MILQLGITQVEEDEPLSAALRSRLLFFASPSGDHVAFTHTRAMGGLLGDFTFVCIRLLASTSDCTIDELWS